MEMVARCCVEQQGSDGTHASLNHVLLWVRWQGQVRPTSSVLRHVRVEYVVQGYGTRDEESQVGARLHSEDV